MSDESVSDVSVSFVSVSFVSVSDVSVSELIGKLSFSPLQPENNTIENVKININLDMMISLKRITRIRGYYAIKDNRNQVTV